MSKSALNNAFSGERAEERVAAPSLMQNGIEVRAKIIVIGLIKQYQNRQEAVTLGGLFVSFLCIVGYLRIFSVVRVPSL